MAGRLVNPAQNSTGAVDDCLSDGCFSRMDERKLLLSIELEPLLIAQNSLHPFGPGFLIEVVAPQQHLPAGNDPLVLPVPAAAVCSQGFVRLVEATIGGHQHRRSRLVNDKSIPSEGRLSTLTLKRLR